MIFALLQTRLIALLKRRIRSGELTERGLARVTGLSQPHVHNVLKGIRSLSFEYADQIVDGLRIPVTDLLSATELSPGPGIQTIPFVEGFAGLENWPDFLRPTGETYEISRLLLGDAINPVAVRLADDPLLFPYYQPGDFIIINRGIFFPSELESVAVYLVRTAAGALVRSVRIAGSRLYLITPATASEPRRWDSIPWRDESLSTLILGRLVWLSRKIPEI